ncbi:transcriptional repressor p66-beta-like protein [Lates japonicus]|uniref:Transcriptional repressor p66-beta-like protein n=1 Tax=Lates japonicus TaxID=270547 RepID=A0AAD3N001_LATJO|nr:transcriptional repressor p66-beta-like protein [Lates japonicus]
MTLQAEDFVWQTIGTDSGGTAVCLDRWSDYPTNELSVCLHQGGERLLRPNQRLSAACRCRGLVVRIHCSASGPDREPGDAGGYADVLIDNRAALLRYLLMQADMSATSSRRLELFIYI